MQFKKKTILVAAVASMMVAVPATVGAVPLTQEQEFCACSGWEKLGNFIRYGRYECTACLAR